MKIHYFYLIFRVAAQKDNTHDTLHLIIFNRFRKNVQNTHLKTLKDFL